MIICSLIIYIFCLRKSSLDTAAKTKKEQIIKIEFTHGVTFKFTRSLGRGFPSVKSSGQGDIWNCAQSKMSERQQSLRHKEYSSQQKEHQIQKQWRDGPVVRGGNHGKSFSP